MRGPQSAPSIRYGPSDRAVECDESPPPGPRRDITRCYTDTYVVDLFDADGRYLGEVERPTGNPRILFRTSFIRDDLMLFRIEDDLGTVMVKRYRLVPPAAE